MSHSDDDIDRHNTASDLRQAIHELADAQFNLGEKVGAKRGDIGASMVAYSIGDRVKALVERAERIEAATHALADEWRQWRGSEMEDDMDFRVRDLLDALSPALAPVSPE